jgi:hypothetical protein
MPPPRCHAAACGCTQGKFIGHKLWRPRRVHATGLHVMLLMLCLAGFSETYLKCSFVRPSDRNTSTKRMQQNRKYTEPSVSRRCGPAAAGCCPAACS